MIVDYLSSLAGWLIWGWIAFMGAAMVVSLIGSGFKATTATSTFALCGIFGLLLLQVTGVKVEFQTLFNL